MGTRQTYWNWSLPKAPILLLSLQPNASTIIFDREINTFDISSTGLRPEISETAPRSLRLNSRQNYEAAISILETLEYSGNLGPTELTTNDLYEYLKDNGANENDDLQYSIALIDPNSNSPVYQGKLAQISCDMFRCIGYSGVLPGWLAAGRQGPPPSANGYTVFTPTTVEFHVYSLAQPQDVSSVLAHDWQVPMKEIEGLHETYWDPVG